VFCFFTSSEFVRETVKMRTVHDEQSCLSVGHNTQFDTR